MRHNEFYQAVGINDELNKIQLQANKIEGKLKMQIKELNELLNKINKNRK